MDTLLARFFRTSPASPGESGALPERGRYNFDAILVPQGNQFSTDNLPQVTWEHLQFLLDELFHVTANACKIRSISIGVQPFVLMHVLIHRLPLRGRIAGYVPGEAGDAAKGVGQEDTSVFAEERKPLPIVPGINRRGGIREQDRES